MTRFEYDPGKNRGNEERHGVSLSEAEGLWARTHVIVPAKNVLGEGRCAIIGDLDGKIYVAIFTRRGDIVRLISCHRADRRWEKIYESRVQEES